ncbi:hypothetical protein GQR58_016621 [Nymphon striatum]|nr:hypothetical protein GQR58_016621 [Nymphon striatum]
MPEGQLSVSHSPLLTEESVSTGLGSMLDEPNSNGAEFFSQMREESLLTTMMDVREFGDDQERDLMPPVLQNMTVLEECIPTGGRRRSRQHFFYATRVNQTGSLRRILRRYFQNGDSRVNTREHGESKRWKNIYFVIINCIFCCNFQSLTFAVLGWCLRTLNSPSGYGHVHVQVFKVPPLYKRQLNAVQLVYSLFWGVLSFNVQGMSKMS